MLVSMKSLLNVAEAKGTAIGTFNITSLECAQAVLDAAVELNVPVGLQYLPSHGPIISMDVMAPVLLRLAEDAPIPVCVHLDHGENLSDVQRALDCGFTSVMYDGSMLPYAENVANTIMAVELAKPYGATVEGEVGAMGREEYASFSEEGAAEGALEGSFTEPDVAQAFVEATGVDMLACSFGTGHGMYLSEPKLDFERLTRIAASTKIPIVMHGGSGISDDDFRECIRRGVRKINYYTYMAKAGGEAVRDRCARSTGNVFYHDITLWGIEAMRQNALHTLRVFAGQ